MATTFVDYTGDGNATKAFSFPSFASTDIKVEVDGTLKTVTTHYNITSYTTTGGGNVVFTGGNIPTSPSTIRIYRNTDVDTAQATYAAGSAVKAGDLNNNQTQLLYGIQEEKNQTITATDIKDLAVTRAKIAADAIDGTKLADNAIDSEHYTDGSIDLAHMSANSVDSDQYVDGSIDLAHMSANSVDSDQYVDGSIDLIHMSANSVDSDQYVDGSIDTIHIADTNVTLAKVENVTGGQFIVGNSSNRPTAVAMSGDATLGNDGSVTIANDAVEIGMIGCEQTTISDSDSHLPTSGAVVDYVAAQLAPIGGLEVIADDESFPNTIAPAGVVISITDAAGLQVNSSGVSTNADTLDNSTVTINGFPSELRGGVGSNPDPYVFQSGAGLMVKSTGSSQTYDYHQALIRESDFVQLSDDINDFNERYRVAAGEPGSDNHAGDLVFDTNADKMKVRNAANNAWDEVASVGDFKFLVPVNPGTTTLADWGNTGLSSGNSGTSWDLREATNTGSVATTTSALQLIISVNGVIQKPNTGSWSGSGEGFYRESAGRIRFATAPTAGASVFVIQVGSATTLNVPADNSVTGAKIALGSDAAGDIMYYNGTDYARLGVGSAGQMLQVNSGASAPEWTAAPSGTTNLSNTANGTSLTVESSSGTNTALPAVTTSAWGVMTDEDKTKLDGIASSANAYTHPNHSGEVTSTADGATVIADDIVDEANLKVDNSPTNDYVLTAKSSAAGGLTWAEAQGGGISSSILENVAALTANHTITTNNNGLVAGPFSTGSYTLTIPSGSVFTVV